MSFLILFEMPRCQRIIQIPASPWDSTRQIYRGMAYDDLSSGWNSNDISDIAYKRMHASDKLLRILQRLCLCIQGL